MKRLIGSGLLMGMLVTAGAATAAHAAAMNRTVSLHAPMKTHMMAIEHAYGSVALRYSAHDVSIRLTAQRLPAPSMLHEGAYVLWLVKGMHHMAAGALTVRNGMGAYHGMVMNTTFRKLVVTAEKSAQARDPMGPQILVGAVM